MYNLVSRVHLVHFTLVHLPLLPTAKRANVFSLKAFLTLTWVITKCESEMVLQVKHWCFPILLTKYIKKELMYFRFDVECF